MNAGRITGTAANALQTTPEPTVASGRDAPTHAPDTPFGRLLQATAMNRRSTPTNLTRVPHPSAATLSAPAPRHRTLDPAAASTTTSPTPPTFAAPAPLADPAMLAAFFAGHLAADVTRLDVAKESATASTNPGGDLPLVPGTSPSEVANAAASGSTVGLGFTPTLLPSPSTFTSAGAEARPNHAPWPSTEPIGSESAVLPNLAEAVTPANATGSHVETEATNVPSGAPSGSPKSRASRPATISGVEVAPALPREPKVQPTNGDPSRVAKPAAAPAPATKERAPDRTEAPVGSTTGQGARGRTTPRVATKTEGPVATKVSPTVTDADDSPDSVIGTVVATEPALTTNPVSVAAGSSDNALTPAKPPGVEPLTADVTAPEEAGQSTGWNAQIIHQGARGEIDVPGLGRVSVSARSRDDGVDVTVTAARHETAAILAPHGGAIEAELRREQINVGRLDIASNQASSEGLGRSNRDASGDTPRSRTPSVADADRDGAEETTSSGPSRVRIVL